MEQSVGKDKLDNQDLHKGAGGLDSHDGGAQQGLDFTAEIYGDTAEDDTFRDLNALLYKIEDDFQPDFEGKTTLDAIKAGLSKAATYSLLTKHSRWPPLRIHAADPGR